MLVLYRSKYFSCSAFRQPPKLGLVLYYTWKYPLRGYILGVLTQTISQDRHWGGDATRVSFDICSSLCLAKYCNAWIMALPRLMNPRGMRVTQNAYFSLITYTKQLLLVTFCYTTAGIEVSFRTDGGRKDRGTWKSK